MEALAHQVLKANVDYKGLRDCRVSEDRTVPQELKGPLEKADFKGNAVNRGPKGKLALKVQSDLPARGEKRELRGATLTWRNYTSI